MIAAVELRLWRGNYGFALHETAHHGVGQLRVILEDRGRAVAGVAHDHGWGLFELHTTTDVGRTHGMPGDLETQRPLAVALDDPLNGFSRDGEQTLWEFLQTVEVLANGTQGLSGRHDLAPAILLFIPNFDKTLLKVDVVGPDGNDLAHTEACAQAEAEESVVADGIHTVEQVLDLGDSERSVLKTMTCLLCRKLLGLVSVRGQDSSLVLKSSEIRQNLSITP